MTNFINRENEFLSLSREISGLRPHISFNVFKIIFSDFYKKKFMSPDMKDFWQLRYLASVSGK